MATHTKFQPFTEALAHKKHNLATDQLVVALSNSAPDASWSQLSQVTQIAYTNLSSRNITTSASAQSGGTYKLTLTDLVLTASGGSVAAFRYVIIYNDTATNDDLICFYDNGSSVTLEDTHTFTCDFDGTNGLFTFG